VRAPPGGKVLGGVKIFLGGLKRHLAVFLRTHFRE